MWWNKTVYSGDLKNYTYPRDIECGDLLQFLKQATEGMKPDANMPGGSVIPFPTTNGDSTEAMYGGIS